jgi:hypothetical protein
VVEINIDLLMPTFLWSGKTVQGREAVEQVDAESPIEAQKILEARGWTELRPLSTDIDDVPTSPTNELQLQRSVPRFWSGWFAHLRSSPAYFIVLVIFLIVGIHIKRTQLEREPVAWLYLAPFMLALGVFSYPVAYWWRRCKRRRSVELQGIEGTKVRK